MILREEMRRVLRFLDWLGLEWRRRAEARTGMPPELMSGMRGYALRQASLFAGTAARFKAAWSVPLTVPAEFHYTATTSSTIPTPLST